MTTAYSFYIFDLDGTWLSTLGDLAASTNHALRAHHLPERSIEEVRQFVGNGVKKLIERAVPSGTDDQLRESVFCSFRAHYLAHSLDTTEPYPEVLVTLRCLKERGAKIGVVSNKLQAGVTDLCQHFFKGLVDVAIGEREGIRRKPSPDMVVEAMRQLGAQKDNTVYIGDSDVDIETAKNSHLPCISVEWGFRNHDFLLEHGATRLIAHCKELLEEPGGACE